MIFSRFFSAIAFLTIIPVRESWKSRRENGMFLAYPVAGLFIGALLSALYLGASYVLPGPLAVLLVIAGSVFLTGAMHVDGLADCSDAFYGTRDRETTLRILKDPRIGTMGGCAIGLSLLARYAALSSLSFRMILVGLPLAAMLSRTAVIAAMRMLPYVRHENAILGTRPPPAPGLTIVAIAVFVVLTALLPIPTVAAALAALAFWRVSWKRIGGFTGDVLGATIEITEIVFLIALAATVKHPLVAGILPHVLGNGGSP